jgi:hypothetical protein
MGNTWFVCILFRVIDVIQFPCRDVSLDAITQICSFIEFPFSSCKVLLKDS